MKALSAQVFSSCGVVVLLGTLGVSSLCFGAKQVTRLPQLSLAASSPHLQHSNACANRAACVLLYANARDLSRPEFLRSFADLGYSADMGFILVLTGGNEAKLRSYALKIGLPAYLDSRGYAAAELGISSAPEWIVADGQGRITARHFGMPAHAAAQKFLTKNLGLSDGAAEEF